MGVEEKSLALAYHMAFVLSVFVVSGFNCSYLLEVLHFHLCLGLPHNVRVPDLLEHDLRALQEVLADNEHVARLVHAQLRHAHAADLRLTNGLG